jgi:hypothetical protein
MDVARPSRRKPRSRSARRGDKTLKISALDPIQPRQTQISIANSSPRTPRSSTTSGQSDRGR